ncbi:MAG: hypothetical protein DCF22_21810 [Leptolyngbya sp.]|nr:MAG: hypothetical protein DCF22_21810 [Leptolyngbya sp.]
MKYLSVLFGFGGAIAIAITATAQEPYPTRPSQGRSIDFLTPEPISIQQPGSATPEKPLTQTTKLNDVANSIQPRVGKSPLTGIGIPEDLIRTPTRRSTEEDPLGFFQVSPPAPSLGINLRAD